jgi:2-dehydro-3-deoxyphosphogluconate aldolase/(4S)-4-hydroxy-2-oxoglutarate aldolase
MARFATGDIGLDEILMTEDFLTRCLAAAHPVLPVLTLERSDRAAPLAEALYRGGARVVEITLRSPVALDAIRRMRAGVPALIVGAGTIVQPEQLAAARAAGAAFAVSPGFTQALWERAQREELPLLPGVMTPSEMLQARAAGCTVAKLFPARVAGGVDLLRAVRGPLAGLRFCPTGGIDADSYRDYLALDNVLCVGGSWFAPPAALECGDWAGIERRMRAVTGI